MQFDNQRQLAQGCLCDMDNIFLSGVNCPHAGTESLQSVSVLSEDMNSANEASQPGRLCRDQGSSVL